MTKKILSIKDLKELLKIFKLNKKTKRKSRKSKSGYVKSNLRQKNSNVASNQFIPTNTNNLVNENINLKNKELENNITNGNSNEVRYLSIKDDLKSMKAIADDDRNNVDENIKSGNNMMNNMIYDIYSKANFINNDNIESKNNNNLSNIQSKNINDSNIIRNDTYNDNTGFMSKNDGQDEFKDRKEPDFETPIKKDEPSTNESPNVKTIVKNIEKNKKDNVKEKEEPGIVPTTVNPMIKAMKTRAILKEEEEKKNALVEDKNEDNQKSNPSEDNNEKETNLEKKKIIYIKLKQYFKELPDTKVLSQSINTIKLRIKELEERKMIEGNKKKK
jgi:hypothetical protein